MQNVAEEKWPGHIERAVKDVDKTGLADARFDMVVYCAWRAYCATSSEDDPHNYPPAFIYSQTAAALKSVVERLEGQVHHWATKN